MPRFDLGKLSWAGCLFLATLVTIFAYAPTTRAEEASSRELETLVPDYAVGFAAVHDVADFREHVRSTQLGQLLQDPAMKPFLDDVRAQLRDRIAGVREKLGISLEDLEGIPSGEMAVATLLPPGGKGAVVLLVQVAGNEERVAVLLEKVADGLAERGAKESTNEAAGRTVHVFDLPENERVPGKRQAVYCLDSGLLIVSDSLQIVEDVLARLDGDAPSLDEDENYQAVMARCRQDAGEDHVPQVRWYVSPFGYAAAVRSLLPEDENARRGRIAAALEAAGFSFIRGVGGWVDVAVDDVELLHRTYIYAPGPREKSANMLSFPNGEDFSLPSWVPRDLATYTTGYCDILKAFDSIGPVFDETIGEGEEGVWQDVLASLKDDPYGPQIDLRNELIVHLGRRITVVTSYEKPITPKSERLLIGIEVADEAQVEAALAKMLANEPDFHKREYKGLTIWEKVPPEPSEMEFNIGGIPGLEETPAEEETAEPLLPNAAVTVTKGHLLIASHLDHLKKILDIEEPRETAARIPELLEVMQKIEEMDGAKSCVRFFSLTDEEYRPTFELIRQGKMPESETVLGRVLNVLLAPPEPGKLREQRIDGSKLPDFEVVRRHLGPAGLFGITEDEGWFFKGFGLPKK
ncbi:hypothetical protein [Thermostilla marina]